ncbi:MAG TPA: hypothetical protein PLX70_02875, partial [Solirubrobacterales bacterium]|nr:hypothetical protein [Solirubrobacterales bacterium]
PVTLASFLDESGYDLADVYTGSRGWSDLCEDASVQVNAPGPDEATRRLVRAGFAHRRKAMARSVDLAIPGSLRAVRDGLEAAGIDPGIRAEALSPAQFAKLSGMIDLAADD